MKSRERLIAACYIIEDQSPYFFATDRAFWCCMLHCLPPEPANPGACST